MGLQFFLWGHFFPVVIATSGAVAAGDRRAATIVRDGEFRAGAMIDCLVRAEHRRVADDIRCGRYGSIVGEINPL